MREMYDQWPSMHIFTRAEEEWTSTSQTSVHEDMERADGFDSVETGRIANVATEPISDWANCGSAANSNLSRKKRPFNVQGELIWYMASACY